MRSHGESGRLGWAGASRELNKKPSQGRSGCSSGKRRLLQSGNGQLEHSAVAQTREGAVLGRFPGPVGSQATGRWSPAWASAQVVAIYCALTMCQAWGTSN